jgi:RNA polymerase sigma-70 factor (ECF subfamily)
MTALDVLAGDGPEDERTDDSPVSRNFTVDTRGNEEACLAEAAKTDPGAFGELYERYYARVFRYVYHRLGNQADAEDVTALVFMKALEALPSYQPRRNSFAPWLFRITRNAVIDYYRRKRKQSPIEDAEHISSGSDPMSAALRSEQRDELHLLVQRLSPDQRDVVLLRYSSELSFTEIASTLSKNEPAIRMLLHRWLRKLKEIMNHE